MRVWRMNVYRSTQVVNIELWLIVAVGNRASRLFSSAHHPPIVCLFLRSLHLQVEKVSVVGQRVNHTCYILIDQLLLLAQPLLCTEKKKKNIYNCPLSSSVFLFTSFISSLHYIFSFHLRVQGDLPDYFSLFFYSCHFPLCSVSPNVSTCSSTSTSNQLPGLVLLLSLSPMLSQSFFLYVSPGIDLTKCRAPLLPYGDGHLTDPVPGSMSQQTQWGRNEGRQSLTANKQTQGTQKDKISKFYTH